MTMNEFVAKKLGEVLAFAEVGAETFKRGREALESVLGVEMVESVIENSKKHGEKIRALAEAEGVADVTLKKLEATGSKLRAMRDLYVGEQWDNPTELLEWSGFFEGAAIVHCKLVDGAAEQTQDVRLIEIAETMLDLHEEILSKAKYLLHEIGKKKSA